MPKHELVKAKFVDELTEPWVQCDSCDGWVHQVCALFNSCENAEDAEEVPYTCPGCRLQSLEQDDSSWKQLETLPSETSVDEFPIKHHRELMASVGSHSPIVKCKPPVKDFTRVLGFGVEAQQKVLDYLRAEDVQAFELSVSQMGGACRTSSQLLSSPLSTFMQNWTRQFLVNAGEPEVADSIVIKVASCIKSQGVLSPIVREQFQSSALKVRLHQAYVTVSGC
jgi:E1A/CREB-binding protein